MDPSTSTVPDVQQQTPSDQQLSQTQSPTTLGQPTQPVQTPPQKTSVAVSVNKEAGSAAVMVTESPDADEDEIVVAPQETKTQVVSQQGGVDLEEEAVEMQPSVPEFSASSEVEKIVEKSPDQEKPEISKAVSDAGVTHSGPGIITVDRNNFSVTKMPETYEQAVEEEKKTQLHDSRHWFAAMIMYIWRKLNPTLGKKKVEEIKEEQPVADGTSSLEQVVTKDADEENNNG